MGAPEFIRSDNGSEFIAKELQAWLAAEKIKTIYIEPASPWQNGWRVPAGSVADRLAMRLVAEGRAEVVCWPCSSIELKTHYSKNLGPSPDAFYTWRSRPPYAPAVS